VGELETLAREVADLVGSAAAAGLPAVGVAHLTVTLHLALDTATAAATVLTGAVHDSGAVLGSHVTTRSWLRAECGLSSAAAAATLARAAALRDSFPATQAAWLASTVPGAVVAEITQGVPRALCRLTTDQRERALPVAEAAALDFARTHPLRDLRWFLARLRERFDTDGVDAAAVAAYTDQHLRFTPVGDGVEVRGFLTAPTAAAVLTVLDQVVDRWYRSGSLAVEDRDSPHDTGYQRVRRRVRRRDHLTALALEHALTGLLDLAAVGTRHDARPHLYLTVSADDLARGLGGDLRLPGRDPASVTAASVRRLLCDAEVTPVFTTSHVATCPGGPPAGPGAVDMAALDGSLRARGREVLHVGRAHRSATAGQRAALAVRDRHCAFPDCEIDPSRCEAHHIHPWELGGTTDLGNLVLLCRGHHHLVHEGRWTVSTRDHLDAGHPDHVAFSPPRPQP
jgi:hypothetical protein